MKPLAIFVFAALARVLWEFPWWVACAAIAALAAGVAIYEWRGRVAMRTRMAAMEAPTRPEFVRCAAEVPIGYMARPSVRCGLAEGHEGAHEGSTCDVVWT